MALPAAGVWEIRSTGNAANGGFFNPARGGTDYSQSDTPVVSVADAVANGTTTVTSATAGFNATTHPGNGVCIAGTWYELISVTNATTIVVDRTITTATGLTLKVGGALDHPATAGASYVAGNTIQMKAGTYTCSSTANVSGGRPNLTVQVSLYGYQATRGDRGTKPVLDAGAASMTVLTMSAAHSLVENIEVTNSAARAGVTGIAASGTDVLVRYCKVSNCATGIAGSGQSVHVTANAVSGCTTGINMSGSSSVAWGNAVLNGTSGITLTTTSVGAVAGRNVVAGCAGTGISAGTGGPTAIYQNTVYGCTGASGNGITTNQGADVQGNLVYGCSQAGFLMSATANSQSSRMLNNAGGGNSGGNLVGWTNGVDCEGFIALTADPFTNAAGLDFSPNNVAGGGPLIRGIPRTFPGLSTTSYLDIGAVQHADPVVETCVAY